MVNRKTGKQHTQQTAYGNMEIICLVQPMKNASLSKGETGSQQKQGTYNCERAGECHTKKIKAM
jgi:hypothetical protein